MPKIAGLDVQKIVADSFKSAGGLPSLTLKHRIVGDRSSTDPTAGASVRTTNHTGQGIVEEYRESQVDGTVVQRGDRKVLILGGTISPFVEPAPNDLIELEFPDGVTTTLTIVENGVTSDPAAATFTCQVRKA